MLKEEPNLFSEIPTGAPINQVKLSRQNRIVYEALKRGEKLNRFTAFEKYGVGTLHSRISDVISAMEWNKNGNKAEEIVKRKFINVNGLTVCEYWLEEEFRKKVC